MVKLSYFPPDVMYSLFIFEGKMWIFLEHPVRLHQLLEFGRYTVLKKADQLLKAIILFSISWVTSFSG